MEGLGSFLLFALFFYLMMRYGCGAHMMHGHGGHAHKKGDETKQIDPVCEMEVESDKGYAKIYHGTLYRFCTRNCLDKFDANPEHYLNKRPGEKDEM